VQTKEAPAIVPNVSSKLQARTMYMDLAKKRYELERQRDEMYQQMKALEEQVERKRKAILAMESYLGIEGDVEQLLEGKNAPEKDKLYFYQQKLYMDEEVGIINFVNGKGEEIDFQNIEKFDEWITKYYKNYLYKSKAIMVWQIRRRDKEYDPNPIINAMINMENKETYFLIRNGDNLYRIHTSVRVPDNLFPTKKDMERIDPKKTPSHYVSEKDVQEFNERYGFLAIQLQGMIDMTHMFGSELKHKLNLFSPTIEQNEHIKFVHDAERSNTLSDGHPPFSKYLQKNQESIEVGSRILWCPDCRGSWSLSREDRGVYHNGNKPDLEQIYILNEIVDDKWGSFKYKFLYTSDDIVFSYWDAGHDRKRRVSWFTAKDELLNLDTITFEDIKYYLTTRMYRNEYYYMIHVMKIVYKVKQEEYDKETPFVQLLVGRTGKDEEEVRKTLNEWKLKNKWKRGVITKNESLAMRMMMRKLTKEVWK
jgi:hypothetical protein